MNANPKISVLTTVFNGELYLQEAIQSVLNQTFPDFEYIVVDNHSTDRSAEILSAIKDPRLVYVRNPQNYGQTKALNIGLKKCRAKYIARLDADDVAYPHRLEAQYNFLETHPEIAVVGSFCTDISRDGKFIRLVKVPTDPLEIKCSLVTSGDLMSWSVGHSTVMMRRAVIEEVGGYKEGMKDPSGYPQDYELWVRLMQRGYEFSNIAGPLIKYRILDHSESRGFVNKTLQDRLEITAEKIRFYVPDLSSQANLSLSYMLEFLPQPSSEAGNGIFSVFDRYFCRIFKDSSQPQKIKRAQNQIKFYYLPQLFLTNKLLSIKEFFCIISQYPSFLFDLRFYRKAIKAFLNRKLSPNAYNFLTKKALSYR